MINRVQIRSLLMPAFLDRGAKRGAPFTTAEEEAVIDAYAQAEAASQYGVLAILKDLFRYNRHAGLKAAIAMMDRKGAR